MLIIICNLLKFEFHRKNWFSFCHEFLDSSDVNQNYLCGKSKSVNFKILNSITFFKFSLRLNDLLVNYKSDHRYMTLNITHKKIGNEIFYNATFHYHKKLETERLFFVFYVPFKSNDTGCENKVIETSIDNCRAALTLKANFVVRAIMQNFIDCAKDPITCPKFAPLRYINCPGEVLDRFLFIIA